MGAGVSVHFFLTGGSLTPQYRRALSTAEVHDDEIVLWYTDRRAEVEGVTLRQAAIPDWLAHSHPQTKFNYLALATLYEHGGMAFGLDSISLRPAHDLLPEGKQLAVARGFPEGSPAPDPFQTDYVALAGAEAIPAMLDELERRVVTEAHVELAVTEGGATGPLLLTRHVLDNPATVAQVPFPALCGWEYGEAWRFYAGEEPGEDVRVIQLYASGYPIEYAAFV